MMLAIYHNSGSSTHKMNGLVRRSWFFILVAVSLINLSEAEPAEAQAPSYSLTPLYYPKGPNSPYRGSSSMGINNRGDGVGLCVTQSPTFTATSWNNSPSPTLLPVNNDGGFFDGFALAINDAGLIAGHASGANGPHMTLWTGGVPQDLGCLCPNLDIGAYVAGSVFSDGADINNNGNIAGYSLVDSGENTAVIWTNSSGMLSIGTLPPPHGGYSRASAINANGQIIGASGKAIDSTLFLWTPYVPNGTTGSMQNLIPNGDGGSGIRAYDINDVGQIVGSFHTGEPFLWTQGGGAVELSPFDYIAQAINNAGVIVGNSNDPEVSNFDPQVALRWDAVNGWIDLNTLINAPGWFLRFASDINDNGQIIATAYYAGDDQMSAGGYAVLLTPNGRTSPNMRSRSLALKSAISKQRIVSNPQTSLSKDHANAFHSFAIPFREVQNSGLRLKTR